PFFSQADMQHLTAQGRTLDTVLSQIEIFKKGVPYITLHRPCTVGDGITVLQQSELEALDAMYAQAASAGRVTKFVPASVAASRMFQSLITVHEQEESLESKSYQDFQRFIDNIKDFAFYHDLLE